MPDGPVVLFTNPDHFAGPAAIPALEADGATVIGVEAEPEQVEKALADHGRIDVLINNDAFPAIRAPVRGRRGGPRFPGRARAGPGAGAWGTRGATSS